MHQRFFFYLSRVHVPKEDGPLRVKLFVGIFPIYANSMSVTFSWPMECLLACRHYLILMFHLVPGHRVKALVYHYPNY